MLLGGTVRARALIGAVLAIGAAGVVGAEIGAMLEAAVGAALVAGTELEATA